MKKLCPVALALLTCAGSSSAAAQSAGGGFCYPPEEPYPFRMESSDPLYGVARDEHQTYLEAQEDYVNCLDRERAAALDQLSKSFDLFLTNFGKDAVMEYAAEKRDE